MHAANDGHSGPSGAGSAGCANSMLHTGASLAAGKTMMQTEVSAAITQADNQESERLPAN